ncbi:MAG: hypothetical protein OCD00_14745 [Colwellia sp.]
MLDKIELRNRLVFELDYKDTWEPAFGDVNGRDGFLQVSVNKPEGEGININDGLLTFVFTSTVKAFVKNDDKPDSVEIEDAMLIAQMEVKYKLVYGHSLEKELVEQLIQDESWFFQRDARLFLNEVASGVLVNTAHDYIKLPL